MTRPVLSLLYKTRGKKQKSVGGKSWKMENGKSFPPLVNKACKLFSTLLRARMQQSI